jgi:hypothetical protein
MTAGGLDVAQFIDEAVTAIAQFDPIPLYHASWIVTPACEFRLGTGKE